MSIIFLELMLETRELARLDRLGPGWMEHHFFNWSSDKGHGLPNVGLECIESFEGMAIWERCLDCQVCKWIAGGKLLCHVSIWPFFRRKQRTPET